MNKNSSETHILVSDEFFVAQSDALMISSECLNTFGKYRFLFGLEE